MSDLPSVELSPAAARAVEVALAAIDAVGDDFFMKTGICGKGGQKVPVGTGQGHVRVGKMTVGGTRR